MRYQLLTWHLEEKKLFTMHTSCTGTNQNNNISKTKNLSECWVNAYDTYVLLLPCDWAPWRQSWDVWRHTRICLWTDTRGTRSSLGRLDDDIVHPMSCPCRALRRGNSTETSPLEWDTSTTLVRGQKNNWNCTCNYRYTLHSVPSLLYV